jgi:hypothetical protein
MSIHGEGRVLHPFASRQPIQQVDGGNASLRKPLDRHLRQRKLPDAQRRDTSQSGRLHVRAGLELKAGIHL